MRMQRKAKLHQKQVNFPLKTAWPCDILLGVWIGGGEFYVRLRSYDFFNKKEKSHFSSSEKCDFWAETERFEKQKLVFCNLYQSISGILFCYLLYFATLCAYCSGCSQRGCCQIAVSTPRPKCVDGFYPSARFLFSETGISADSTQAARRRAARKPPAQACAAGGRGYAAPALLPSCSNRRVDKSL